MCILFIYTDPTPSKGKYRLIMASNRDEYYQRPAQSAFLCTQSGIIGGRDMEKGREGGMWLAASIKQTPASCFRLGCILNVTGEEHRHDAKGRGFIINDYFRNNISAENYMKNFTKEASAYNAFNFVTVELSRVGSTVSYLSNAPSACQLFEGKQILGFGNSPIISPLTKVQEGKKKFTDIIQTLDDTEAKDHLVENLLDLLKWDAKHLPDPELETRSPSGFQFLSSVFVKVTAAGYGTRTHSIILIDHDWNLEFIESTMEQPIDVYNPKWTTDHIRAHL